MKNALLGFALAVGTSVALVAPLAAQGGDVPAAQATDASGFARVVLTAGRSTVLVTPFDVTRIAVTVRARRVRVERAVELGQERVILRIVEAAASQRPFDMRDA